MLCFDKIPKWLNGFITILLSLVSFILSTVAVSECKFVRRKVATVPEYIYVEYYGLFNSYVKDKGCEELVFSGSTPSAVRSAQAFGVMASLCAGAILIVLLFQICVAFPKFLRLSLCLVYGICFIFQMLTFTAFAYDDWCDGEKITCELGPDGYTSLMAAVFHLFCVVVLCMVPDQEEPIFKSIIKEFQDVSESKEIDEIAGKTADISAKKSKRKTVTERLDSDGNKTTIKVTIDFDDGGNKITRTETTTADGSVIVSTDTEMV